MANNAWNNPWFTNPQSLSGLGSLSKSLSMPSIPTKTMPTGVGMTPPPRTPETYTLPPSKPMQTAGPFPMPPSPGSMGYNGPVRTGSFLGGGANFGMGGPVPNPMPDPMFGPGSSYETWRQQYMNSPPPVQNTATRHVRGSPDTTSNAGGFYGSKGYFEFRGEPERYKG